MPKIDTQFTSDDQAVIAAYHRQQVELDKLKRKLQETNKAGAKGAAEQNVFLKSQDGKLKEIAENYVGVGAVIGALTSAYQEQKAVLAELGKQAISYQATVSKLALPTGLSPDKVDAIAGRINATPETAAAAIAAVRGQGSVAPERLEQLAGLSADARRVGVDAETAGSLFGALNQLDSKASASQLQDRFAAAVQEGLSASDITKFADTSSLDGKGRFQRSKLLKQLDAAPGSYATARAEFESSGIGSVQLGQQDLEIRQANASRVQGVQAQREEFYAQQFKKDYQNANPLNRTLQRANYAFREFVASSVGYDAGDSAEAAFKLTRQGDQSAAENALLDRQVAAFEQLEAAALAQQRANERRPTYAPLQAAEGGK